MLNLSVAQAQTQAEQWYQTGYTHSIQGQNNAAFFWMLKAANANHAAAQNNIGLSYLHGLGVKKDREKAIIYFEKAANQELAYAQSELAMLYYQQQNPAKARELWLSAAEKNDEYAQFNLASLYLEQQQFKRAQYWFAQAESNQHPDAKNALQQLEKLNVK